MATDKKINEITEKIYYSFGSSTGVLFGIPASLKYAVKTIIKVTLNMQEHPVLAMEWGFKAHEKGWNLEKSQIEFRKVLGE